jgi:hypothetical protein
MIMSIPIGASLLRLFQEGSPEIAAALDTYEP